MSILVTSDTHFCHANIIKYCHRPYQTVEQMNKDLIDRWNSRVSTDDTVIHVGDFALTSDPQAIYEIRKQLNGYIILVVGNHDYSKAKMSRLGFNLVTNRLSLEDTVFVHRPPTAVCSSEQRIVYGHVHNSPHARPCHKCYNACVEVNEYMPQYLHNIKWTHRS